MRQETRPQFLTHPVTVIVKEQPATSVSSLSLRSRRQPAPVIVIAKSQPLATKEPYGCGLSACRSEGVARRGNPFSFRSVFREAFRKRLTDCHDLLRKSRNDNGGERRGNPFSFRSVFREAFRKRLTDCYDLLRKSRNDNEGAMALAVAMTTGAALAVAMTIGANRFLTGEFI